MKGAKMYIATKKAIAKANFIIRKLANYYIFLAQKFTWNEIGYSN